GTRVIVPAASHPSRACWRGRRSYLEEITGVDPTKGCGEPQRQATSLIRAASRACTRGQPYLLAAISTRTAQPNGGTEVPRPRARAREGRQGRQGSRGSGGGIARPRESGSRRSSSQVTTQEAFFQGRRRRRRRR
ncbi:unnamed protein product, partial [Ectocarpus sp. 8 AP-2014]